SSRVVVRSSFISPAQNRPRTKPRRVSTSLPNSFTPNSATTSSLRLVNRWRKSSSSCWACATSRSHAPKASPEVFSASASRPFRWPRHGSERAQPHRRPRPHPPLGFTTRPRHASPTPAFLTRYLSSRTTAPPSERSKRLVFLLVCETYL